MPLFFYIIYKCDYLLIHCKKEDNMLSTEGIKNKEVINISDGRSLGYAADIEVNLELGKIDGIVIPGERGLFGFRCV